MRTQKRSHALHFADEGEIITGTKDEHYDLISVLYHALKNAETFARYVEDAMRSEDPELAEFFEQAEEEELARAQRAKALLGPRLSRTRAAPKAKPE